MGHIWLSGDAGCLGQEVQQALDRDRPVALTTVLTTLDRLFDKSILLREREGKAYRYRPALSEPQLQQRIVDGVLGGLIAQFPKAVAMYFAQQGDAASNFDDRSGNDADVLANLARRLEDIAATREANGEAGGGDGSRAKDGVGGWSHRYDSFRVDLL